VSPSFLHPNTIEGGRRPLTRLAWLAIGAALATMGLKFAAFVITGSVGLLSDAVESSANLVAALTALGAIWYAAKPEDRSHKYGHGKIEYFASGVEGSLIVVAAVAIVWSAADRLLAPRPVESFGLGLAISLIATAINLAVARVLLSVARERRSLVLEADGRHLMTDVWTSLGVVAGVCLVWLTRIEWLDPLIAIVVGLNIALTGLSLLRLSFDGLMDRALPATEEAAVRRAIMAELAPTETFHALRTRQSGGRRFVDFHLLVPGRESVQEAHRRIERIESAVAGAVAGVETTVHVEPVEERSAWEDSPLLPLEEEDDMVPPVVRSEETELAVGSARRGFVIPSADWREQ
jgi:cation diffusion facilitator family transporter